MKSFLKLKKLQINKNKKIPKFIIYSLLQKQMNPRLKSKARSSNISVFFQCNKCKKSFKSFLHLKRHYIEVEYGISIKCKFCGIEIKRMKEHEKFCKKTKDNKTINIDNSNNSNLAKKKEKNPSTLFKDNNIISNELVDNLKQKHNYFEVSDKYIYFQDYIIGEGSFGIVSFGIKTDDNIPVAVKLQISDNGKDELKTEKEILSSFPSYFPFPKFYFHLLEDSGNLLIESLVGPSLDKLYKFCDHSFDEITICNIGIDLLDCLEIIHKNGLVHNDLKNGNIAILLKNFEKEKSKICCTLIDFGLSLKYKPVEEKNAKKARIKSKCGNTKFASFNSLNGGEIGPKDDVESICYILLYYFNNTLPWSNIDKTNKKIYKEKVLEQKRNFQFKEFCSENFLGLSDIYYNIKNLKKEEIPNYKEYKKILMKIIEKNKKGKNILFKFKWQEKFYDVMKELYVNKNFQILNETIKTVFKGYPEQIGFSYLNHLYNEYNL